MVPISVENAAEEKEENLEDGRLRLRLLSISLERLGLETVLLAFLRLGISN